MSADLQAVLAGWQQDADRRTAIVGPKLMDGLRAIATHRQVGVFADEILIRQGYPPKVADDILERLARKRLIDYGVSARTGWLTDQGRRVLGAATP